MCDWWGCGFRLRFVGKDAYERSTQARERFRAAVFAAWGTDCWICGLPGATTADHVVTRQQIRDLGLDEALMFDPDNGRPAHHRCNARRGGRPRGRVASRVEEVADGW